MKTRRSIINELVDKYLINVKILNSLNNKSLRAVYEKVENRESQGNMSIK